MAAQGMENKEIGGRLDLPRQIVSKWRKRFCDLRLEGLHDEPRPGRPRASWGRALPAAHLERILSPLYLYQPLGYNPSA